MDLLAALRNNQLTEFSRTFTHTASNGRRMTLAEMDSVHLLNASLQIVRRLRDRIPQFSEQNPVPQRFYLRGGNTYQSNNAHGAEPALNQLFYFCWEIERRNNFQRNGDRVRFLNMMRSIFDERFLRVDLATAIHGAEAANRAIANSTPPETTFDRAISEILGILPDMGESLNLAPRRGRPSARPSGSIDLDTLGTITLSGSFMRDNIRMERSSFDLSQWLAHIPPPFSNVASQVAFEVFEGVRPRGHMMTSATLSVFIAEFQSRKERAIAEGTLTNEGWVPLGNPNRAGGQSFSGTPTVAGLWEPRFDTPNPFQLITTTDTFSLEQLNRHLQVTRQSQGDWYCSLSGGLTQRIDSDFNSHISDIDRDLSNWLRPRTREFANYTTAMVREQCIRHIYAIIEHNLQHRALTPERWTTYLPLSLAPVGTQTGRFSSAVQNLSTFPRPETPRQARNPILMMPAQEIDYRRDPEPSTTDRFWSDMADGFIEKVNKKKTNRKDEANTKKAKEQAAELAAKHEENLIGVNKRKIQV